MLVNAILNAVTKDYSEFHDDNDVDIPISVEESNNKIWYSGIRENTSPQQL